MSVLPEASSPQRHRYTVSRLVIVLAIFALAVGGAVSYANKPVVTVTITSTQVVTQSSTVTKSIIPRAIMDGKQFLPQLDQTFHDAWLLFAPTGNGSYVLTIHAEGLSPPQGLTDYYVVKGVTANSTVEQVPLGQSIANSILQVDARGVGNFYIILKHDPSLVYEAIEIVHISGSGSPTSTVVGTASLLPPTAG